MKNILDFWYSERCTRQMKLIICISTCCIIFLSSTDVKLSTTHVIFALCLGATCHFIHHAQNKLKASSPYKTGFDILFFTFPILAMIGLITTLPNEGQVLLIFQSFGFIAVGFFIVSIYSQRTKRTENT